MRYLPVFYDIKGKDCLIVGGGKVAARKAELLLKAGAYVHVVAPDIHPSLQKLLQEKGSWRIGHYRPIDLEQMQLVIAATNDQHLNQQVAADAKQRKILVNVVDQPQLCNFVLPSIIERDPIIVAVSSGGRSPTLARLLRARLETLIPSAYGNLAQLMGKFRVKVKKQFVSLKERRAFWENIVDGPIAELVFAGREAEAEKLLTDALTADSTEVFNKTGEVYLVGAGPGDPDLLTFRALRLMQKADIVLYDRLVSSEVLNLCRREAERIHVGKQAQCAESTPQDSINALLVRLAKEGKRVLRLKGGDPFIFGRGGEEMDTLAEEGIPFQIVPGITAASGCAAYAGIPLTHRDYAQSVRFITGHLQDNSCNLPWNELVQPQQTLVIYMGLIGLKHICEQLIRHGMPKTMPVALIQQGTTPQQKVVEGTAETIVKKVEIAQIKAPTIIIIGEVVRLRAKLNWFNPRQ